MNIDIFVKRLVHDYNEKQAAVDSKQPALRTKREPSKTEQNEEYKPSQYGILFCCHGKSYFDKCASCHRTDKIATLEYAAFCKRNKLRI